MGKKKPFIQFKGFGPAADASEPTDRTEEAPVPGKARLVRRYGTDDGHREHRHRHRRRREPRDEDDDDDDDEEEDLEPRRERRAHRHRDHRHPHRDHRHHRRDRPERDPENDLREIDPERDPERRHRDPDRHRHRDGHRHHHHHRDRGKHRDPKYRHRSRSRHRKGANDDDRDDDDALEEHRRRARRHHRPHPEDPEEEEDDDEEGLEDDEDDDDEEQLYEEQRRSMGRRRHKDDLEEGPLPEPSRSEHSRGGGSTRHPYKRTDYRDSHTPEGGREYDYERMDHREGRRSVDERRGDRRTGSIRSSRGGRDLDDDGHGDIVGSTLGGSHRSRSRSQGRTRMATGNATRGGDDMRGSLRGGHSARGSVASPPSDYPAGTHGSDEDMRGRSRSMPRGSHRDMMSGYSRDLPYMGNPAQQRPMPGFLPPGSRHGSIGHPGSMRDSGLLRGSMRGSGLLPGRMRGSGLLPGRMRGSGVLPGSMRGPVPLPGSMRGPVPLAGSMHGSGMDPRLGIDPRLSRRHMGPGFPPGAGGEFADDRIVADDYQARVRRKARRGRHGRRHHRSRRHHHRRHSKHRRHRRRKISGPDAANRSDEDDEAEGIDGEEYARRRQKASRNDRTEDGNSRKGSEEGSGQKDDDDEDKDSDFNLDDVKEKFTKKNAAKAGALALLAVGAGLLIKKVISGKKKKKKQEDENSEYMSNDSGGVASAGGQGGYFQEAIYHPRIPPAGLFSVKVPQNQVCIVERGGRYHRKLNSGSNVITPCVDKIAYCHSLKQMAMPIPWQQCHTSDRIPLRANGMLYWRIEDPVAASYGVDNPYHSIILLAQTCIRNEVGRQTKERAFQNRVGISDRILDEMNDACRPWGVRCLKFELRDMELPLEIREKIEAEEEVERQKRLAIIQSEADRAAAINKAEAELQVQMKASQARQLEIVNQAIGEAHAIQERGEAVANALRDVAEVVNEPGGQQAMQMRLAEQFIDAYAKTSRGPVVAPPDPNNVASNMNSAMGLLNTLGQNSPASQIPLAPISPNPFADPPAGSKSAQPNVQSGASSPLAKPKPIEPPQSETSYASSSGPQHGRPHTQKPAHGQPSKPLVYPQPGQGRRHQGSTPSSSHDDRTHSHYSSSGPATPESHGKAKRKDKQQKPQKGLKGIKAMLEDKVEEYLK